jgi:prolyl oligopeptidase family protein
MTPGPPELPVPGWNKGSGAVHDINIGRRKGVNIQRRLTLYACGVDIVGPSNLETLLRTIPPYWESIRADLYRAIGDINTAAGLAQAHERSPLFSAANIRKPLLIAQGANDPRVKQAESDQMVAALRAGGIPVTYVCYSPTTGTALRGRRTRSPAMH